MKWCRTKLFVIAVITVAVLYSVLYIHEVGAEGIIPNTFRFERALRFGASGEDVRYLQVLLNRDSETRVNTPGLIGGAGAETTYFGNATRNAVLKFQIKYAAEVLYPARLVSATGIVGPFTRNKLNTLLTLPPQTTSVPVVPFYTPPVLEQTPLATAIAPVSSPTPVPPSFDETNQKARAALVNIVCTTKQGGAFNLISGSGITIDPRGVILTNAHLGQYFLLQDFPTAGNLECTIRTGEPARNKYKATVLFVSPQWIHDNAAKIKDETPMGTGENDFALLFIDRATNPDTSFPETFPYVPMEVGNKELREPTEVLVTAYPVGFLSGIAVQRDLYPSSSIVMTGEVYSFGENTPDIFSVGGSVVAQQGSSGGGVVSREGRLLGLIVTSSLAATTGERDLHALTVSHIKASFKKQTGDMLEALLQKDLKTSAKNFDEKVAPELKRLLEDALTSNQ